MLDVEIQVVQEVTKAYFACTLLNDNSTHTDATNMIEVSLDSYLMAS